MVEKLHAQSRKIYSKKVAEVSCKRRNYFKKIELKDEDFTPKKFKQDSEGYFEKLLASKAKNERYNSNNNLF